MGVSDIFVAEKRDIADGFVKMGKFHEETKKARRVFCYHSVRIWRVQAAE
jgi:hypothetical protein